MRLYNWQQSDWPNFKYDLSGTLETLMAIANKMGLISGQINHLSESLQTETLIDLMVEEAVKTSQIEGERLHAADVLSSIKNKLGLNPKTISVRDKRASGIAELMVDVRKTFKQPLTEETLFDWHLMVMSGTFNPSLRVGCWRIDAEPMQVISYHQGRAQVHFEAPPAKEVREQMHQFIRWFNSSAPGKPKAIAFAPVRAAIAHLYFESIHPFDDGNGRVGRAIAEKALSQGAGYPVMMSLSHSIEADRKAYYAALKKASASNEITEWVDYFVNMILTAQNDAEKQINFVLKKSLFYQKYEKKLNERQLKIIKRMLQAGIKGFEGGMTAKKYMKIAVVSKATATRDLQHLTDIHAFKQIGEGRSVHYELNL